MKHIVVHHARRAGKTAKFLTDNRTIRLVLSEIEHDGDLDSSLNDLRKAGCTNIKVLGRREGQAGIECTLPEGMVTKTQLAAKLSFAVIDHSTTVTKDGIFDPKPTEYRGYFIYHASNGWFVRREKGGQLLAIGEDELHAKLLIDTIIRHAKEQLNGKDTKDHCGCHEAHVGGDPDAPLIGEVEDASSKYRGFTIEKLPGTERYTAKKEEGGGLSEYFDSVQEAKTAIDAHLRSTSGRNYDAEYRKNAVGTVTINGKRVKVRVMEVDPDPSARVWVVEVDNPDRDHMVFRKELTIDTRLGATLNDIKKHPQYTEADYQYLKGKGYSIAEILEKWDEERYANKPAQQHTNKPWQKDMARKYSVRVKGTAPKGSEFDKLLGAKYPTGVPIEITITVPDARGPDDAKEKALASAQRQVGPLSNPQFTVTIMDRGFRIGDRRTLIGGQELDSIPVSKRSERLREQAFQLALEASGGMKPKGKRWLRQELINHGIDESSSAFTYAMNAYEQEMKATDTKTVRVGKRKIVVHKE